MASKQVRENAPNPSRLVDEVVRVDRNDELKVRKSVKQTPRNVGPSSLYQSNCSSKAAKSTYPA